MPETQRFVQCRSRKDIARLAETMRSVLELGQERVSMLPLLEWVLPDLLTDYAFQIVDDEIMPGAEGMTDLRAPIIHMPESKYSALRGGCTRARFTAAHELGHLLMHSSSHVHYARAEYIDPRTDPEWQANEFAAAFLMPEAGFRECHSLNEAMTRFGVGYRAAKRRAMVLRHHFKKKGRKPMTCTP